MSDVREELLATVRGHIMRVQETDDPCLLQRRDVQETAWRLAVLLQKGPPDPEGLMALGWFYWLRSETLRGYRQRIARGLAVKALAPVFLYGGHGDHDIGDFPTGLLPALADSASRLASRNMVEAADSADETVLNALAGGLRRVVRCTEPGHRELARRHHWLGIVLGARFRLAGDPADLDEAIEEFEAGLHACQRRSRERPVHLSRLGFARTLRFEASGDTADLDAGIDCLQAAVREAHRRDPDRRAYRSSLGTALLRRAEVSGDPAVLESAVGQLRMALRPPPADPAARARALANLAAVLHLRGLRSGRAEDTDEAVDHLRDAVGMLPAGDLARAGMSALLGEVLRSRFEHSGRIADLDAAIDSLRESIRVLPAGHHHRGAALCHLANALHTRYKRLRDKADLNAGVDLSEEALHSLPDGSPLRGKLLVVLGVMLANRNRGSGERGSGERGDAARAVEALRAAERLFPAGHPLHAFCLSLLVSALLVTAVASGDRAELDSAIARLRKAAAPGPPGLHQPEVVVHNLGLALLARSELLQALPDDEEEAIGLLRRAVRLMAAEDPRRTATLSALARALHARYCRTQQPTDLDAAEAALTEAWEQRLAAPSSRVRAGWMLARLVADSEPGRAADILEAVVRLLPDVSPRQLMRADQQQMLGECTGLAGEAAALALADPRRSATERATRALSLLEAGRAVLLSQALDTRGDLSDLRRRHPALATRFDELRSQLDEPADGLVGAPSVLDMSDDGQPRFAADRHEQVREFTAVVAEIRAQDGFASFGLPPALHELLAEAVAGPIVTFNVSRYRSDALLLTHDGVTCLELPRLTETALAEQIVAFQRALSTISPTAGPGLRRQGQDALVQTLGWLWDTAAGPVLDALGCRNQPAEDDQWPRVWWVPGGLLGQLPLHAAGHHSDAADRPDRRTVMDRVISSYTPTVRALRYARERTRRQDPLRQTVGNSLIVAMPTTPGLDEAPLPFVDSEVAGLLGHLDDPTVLREPGPGDPGSPPTATPTRANVLARLADCAIAHFACHGSSHPTDPSRSQLFLHDHEDAPFTVSSLAPVRLSHAQLAYLSACRTSSVEVTELADEAIHLASAFQLAGFPHVIGTLWEINDRMAEQVADVFYTGLRGPDGMLQTSRSAEALHRAVRAARDGRGLPGSLDRTRSPYLWAGFLHAGI